jgi:hypothetical protein
MIRWVLALGLVWLGTMAAHASPVRMVVADMPYPRVWAAALEAVRDFPIERMGEREIMTGWRERPARPEEHGFERVSDRVHLQVEAFGERITRVTATSEVRGWRHGRWVDVGPTGVLERDVLARIRAALS